MAEEKKLSSAKTGASNKRKFIALVNRECHFNNKTYDFKEGDFYELDDKEHIAKLTHFNANVLLETNSNSILGRLLAKAETDQERRELVRKYRIDIQAKSAYQKEA